MTCPSCLLQELQAEQQQLVHGRCGHPLHRHHKEMELHDPGPAGFRYLATGLYHVPREFSTFSIPSLSGSRWGKEEGYSNSVRDCAEFEFRGTVCYKAVPTQILIPPVESLVFCLRLWFYSYWEYSVTCSFILPSAHTP